MAQYTTPVLAFPVEAIEGLLNDAGTPQPPPKIRAILVTILDFLLFSGADSAYSARDYDLIVLDTSLEFAER